MSVRWTTVSTLIPCHGTFLETSHGIKPAIVAVEFGVCVHDLPANINTYV
jgi:hypothetical protein